MDLDKARRLLEFIQSKSAESFASNIVMNLEIVNGWVEDGRTVLEFSLPMMPEFLNEGQTLHGAASGTIIIEVTTIAIMCQDRVPRESNTASLSLSFMSTAQVGDTLRVISRCDKAGKNLGFAYTEIFVGDRLVTTGKYQAIIDPTPLM